MACSKAEDLINQLIEATLKLLDFGLNIMDALRVQKLLTIRNQKIGLISDDACLPECSLRFSLNFDLMMFNKLLRSACLRARATLNELRVCRLRYPNAPLVLEPKTKVKFLKLQRKIQEFDEAVRSDKMIARRDLRDFREIAIIFSQLEHDLKLLICSLECASTMKDTVLFAAPITDVMTVLSIVLSRLERLAQKAEIDEKIAAAEQQKALLDQKTSPAAAQSNSATPYRQNSANKDRPNDNLYNSKNTNRTSQQQRRHDMTTMIAAASQQNLSSTKQQIVSINRKTKHKQENKLQPTITSVEQQQESNKTEESASEEADQDQHHLQLPKHNNRHYAKIKSTISQSLPIPDETVSLHQPIDQHTIKQARNRFIRKWAADVRNTCAHNQIIQQTPLPDTFFDKTNNGVHLTALGNDRHRSHTRTRRSSSSSSSSFSSVTSSISSSNSHTSNEVYKNNRDKVCSSSFTSLSAATAVIQKKQRTKPSNKYNVDVTQVTHSDDRRHRRRRRRPRCHLAVQRNATNNSAMNPKRSNISNVDNIQCKVS